MPAWRGEVTALWFIYSALQKCLLIKDTKLRYMEGTDFQIMGILHLLKTIS